MSALVVALVVMVAAGCAADLDVAPDGVASAANDINDAGWIVGTRATTDGRTEAYVRNPDGEVHTLPGLAGAQNVTAEAINATGVVVGWDQRIENGVSLERPIRWDLARTPHDLGSLGGPRARAVDINAGGVIVGGSDTPSSAYASVLGPNNPVVWEPAGGPPTALAELTPTTQSWATAVNDAGLIVGHGTKFMDDDHALKWLPGTRQLVDIAPDLALAFVSGLGVNEAGDIVGSYGGSGLDEFRPGSGVGRGILFPAGGGAPILLDGIAGDRTSIAKDIADDGTIIGQAVANGQTHAVRWDPVTRVATDLTALGGHWSTARSINATGEIVGASETDDGPVRACSFGT